MFSLVFPLAFLLTFLLTIVPTEDASAHRLHAAMTTVLFNDRTERIEIMHRFYLHDAEQLATEIAGSGANLMDDPEDRQRFGIYVHERFNLYSQDDGPDGSRLPITLRGTEVDGDFLWVYQAMRYPSPQLDRLAISHGALRALWPEQVNTVNVERDGRVQTLTFRDAVDRLFVEF